MHEIFFVNFWYSLVRGTPWPALLEQSVQTVGFIRSRFRTFPRARKPAHFYRTAH